jgi:pre-mRNA-splicing factor ATP-dependent RNA helicase DHX16
MDDKALKSWISSQLHDLLGFAEGALASYVASVARKHTSAPSLAAALASAGLPAGTATEAFAANLLSKLPAQHAAAAPSAAQLEARQARTLLRKNATYTLLDDPAPSQPAAAAPEQPPPALEPGKRQRHIRKPLGEHDEGPKEDHEAAAEAAAVARKRQKRRAWEEEEGEEGESLEARAERLAQAARERDQQERKDFEERLKQRDEARTRKVAEDEQELSRAEKKEAARRK